MARNKKRRLAAFLIYQNESYEPKDFFLALLMRTLRFLIGAGAAAAFL